MTQQQGSLPVDRMCALAQVGRAGYYRHWQAVAPRRAGTALRDEVQRLALAQRHYGYRRIAILLRRAGWQVNRKRVLRLMREDNLLCLRQKAFVPATMDSRHSWRVYPNLAWRLQPTGVNQLWVADITYVRLAEGFVYLAVVLDAFSRRAIGWAMEDHLESSLALAALEMALANRVITPGLLVHHSDRGVQYACRDYIGRLEAHAIEPSMSRVGCPYDNAMAESFMKTLKQEEVDGRSYRDLAQARQAIDRFLEQVYNRQRLHSALAYHAPADVEASPTLLLSVMKRSTAGSNATCPDFAVSH
jgi:transposase InsO family protein